MTSLAEHRQAYASGVTDPHRVAGGFLATEPVGGELDAFVAVDPDRVLAEAGESARRLAAGRPRGPLEGILVGVKDFYDVRGYETRLGTSSIVTVAENDSALVARLRAAGAVIAGKTRGTELGLSPIGPNASGGSPRNPHDTRRPSGGSSSGSAVAVAAGQVPLAVGSDGGGSLRIPPALSGVLGLKPSYGRVPDDAAVSSGWWSLNQPGPIAGNVADLAEGYAVLADEDAIDLTGGDRLRAGVDWSWWGVPDPAVDEVCRTALEDLDLRRVRIDQLHLARIAEYVTVATEVAAAMHDRRRTNPRGFGPDVQLILRLAEEFSGVDYLRAQQVRTLLARSLDAAFTQVDVLVTPMTACTAPLLPGQLWNTSFLDEGLLRRLTAYAFPANLTGLPAASIPVGVDPDGMPVGLQIVGPAGREDLVLRFAAHLERIGRSRAPMPPIHHELLEQQMAGR